MLPKISSKYEQALKDKLAANVQKVSFFDLKPEINK
jgi:hypothetical protein